MNPYNIQEFTNAKAPTIVATYDASISASTEVTLNAATSWLEVSAITSGIFLRWGTADVSTSAFDEYISPGTTRIYIRPINTTAVNFIQAVSDGVLVVLEK